MPPTWSILAFFLIGDHLGALGAWLEERARWAAPLAVLIYSFGPIPSNQLFISAGLTGMRLERIVAAFLVGRLISYTFWVSTAHLAAQRFDDLFAGHLRSGGALALELLSLGVLVVVARLDWRRVLDRSGPGRGRAG